MILNDGLYVMWRVSRPTTIKIPMNPNEYYNTRFCWNILVVHAHLNRNKAHNTQLGTPYKCLPLPYQDPSQPKAKH